MAQLKVFYPYSNYTNGSPENACDIVADLRDAISKEFYKSRQIYNANIGGSSQVVDDIIDWNANSSFNLFSMTNYSTTAPDNSSLYSELLIYPMAESANPTTCIGICVNRASAHKSVYTQTNIGDASKYANYSLKGYGNYPVGTYVNFSLNANMVAMSSFPVYLYQTPNTIFFAYGSINNSVVITRGINMITGENKWVRYTSSVACSKEFGSPVTINAFPNTSKYVSFFIDNMLMLSTTTNVMQNNVDCCNKFITNQLILGDYVCQDIYYIDGGMQVPEAGIFKMNTDKFLILNKNFALKLS